MAPKHQTPTDQAFAQGVKPWKERLGLARDAVRQELVARQLESHLPAPVGSVPLRALDAGCGQGTQLIRLARAGYHAVGVDLSEELLDAARAAMAAEPAEVRSRITLIQGDLHDLKQLVDPGFDVVCCHGVLMYLPSLERALHALASASRPGGLISVLTRNRAGIAMRAGMTGDWRGALDGFDARSYGNRLGLADVRAHDPQEVVIALREMGVVTTQWYGVRLFSDHWGDAEPPSDFEDLLAAELEAGRREPYRRLAALTHTIGVRTPSAEPPAAERES